MLGLITSSNAQQQNGFMNLATQSAFFPRYNKKPSQLLFEICLPCNRAFSKIYQSHNVPEFSSHKLQILLSSLPL